MRRKLKILITAGPTREKIDDIRFLSNRSSGKMGYALAEAAFNANMNVILVSGPVSLKPLPNIETISVESAAEMAEAVFAHSTEADIVISAAAVADYRPATPTTGKIKKKDGELILKLERTTDILKTLGEMKTKNQLLVGFAAETEKLIPYAKEKLEKKNLDLIVANNVANSKIGFNSDSNAVTLVFKSGRIIELRKNSKKIIAEQIINEISQLLNC